VARHGEGDRGMKERDYGFWAFVLVAALMGLIILRVH
jgi:hypothetical protein